MMYQPWCIQYPEWEQAQSYEHKFGLTYFAKAKNVSAQKKCLGLEGAVSARQVSSQSSPTSKTNQSYHIHFTILTLLLRSSVVHGASVRCLVDRGGASLEFGKPEFAFTFDTYVICYSTSNTNPLFPLSAMAESSPTFSEAESSLTLSKTESSLTSSESSVSVRDQV
ncbi:hypothetical protein CR513_12887, partial [Mucuna pruriens]